MKRIKVFVFMFSFLLFLSSDPLAAHTVLLVHSYHAGYQWTDDITAGVKMGLAGTGADLEILYEFSPFQYLCGKPAPLLE